MGCMGLPLEEESEPHPQFCPNIWGVRRATRSGALGVRVTGTGLDTGPRGHGRAVSWESQYQEAKGPCLRFAASTAISGPGRPLLIRHVSLGLSSLGAGGANLHRLEPKGSRPFPPHPWGPVTLWPEAQVLPGSSWCLLCSCHVPADPERVCPPLARVWGEGGKARARGEQNPLAPGCAGQPQGSSEREAETPPPGHTGGGCSSEGLRGSQGLTAPRRGSMASDVVRGHQMKV